MATMTRVQRRFGARELILTDAELAGRGRQRHALELASRDEARSALAHERVAQDLVAMPLGVQDPCSSTASDHSARVAGTTSLEPPRSFHHVPR